MTWAAVRWILLMFLFAQGLEAPLVATPSTPIKPLKVWTGIASWYGPRFQGRTTANGEQFDMTALTAAHPTLPFGSLVRVTNPRSGKSQVVRINDRGPFVEGRELDVSYAVANKIGLINGGLVRLRLELLEVPPHRVDRQ
jgi:rare lipoprotein A